jgi:outer membrane protein assembly factor BamD (BamD/ComL family)
MFMVAKGEWYFNADQHPEAQGMFEEALREYSNSDAAAEAVFFQGVSRYKLSHDPKPLRAAYETLTAKFPGSEWTKRAAPYRLIPA